MSVWSFKGGLPWTSHFSQWCSYWSHEALGHPSWPPPHSVTPTLRSFLGLTGYCPCFMKIFASIAGPLITDLLKHNHFDWDMAAHSAFLALKADVTSLSVLGLLEFSATFDVTTDASGAAIDVVLLLDSHPLHISIRNFVPNASRVHVWMRNVRHHRSKKVVPLPPWSSFSYLHWSV